MALRTWSAENGAVRRLTLDAGKGNIVDSALLDELGKALSNAVDDPAVAAVLVDAAGPNFSFGASVEEHRPETVEAMLTKLHKVIFRLLDLPVPAVFAVRGQCLGGGLELALAGSRIVVHATAKFAQPEVKLGVFAPAASALLPMRVGQARAEDLLLSGRTVEADEAHRIGLVDDVCAEDQDPAECALGWIRAALLPQSRSSLRFAVRAARRSFANEASAQIMALERIYLRELMATADAREGIQAFLEKRRPTWRKPGAA